MTGPDAKKNPLTARAEAGDAHAQYALAAELNAAGRTDEARRWLECAANAGHPDALFTVAAARLAGAGGVQPDRAAAIDGLTRAAAAGNLAAKRLLAALYAKGFGVTRDWRKACALLAEAVSVGDPFAAREAAMLLFMADPDDPAGAAMIERASGQDGLAAAIAVRRVLLDRAGAGRTMAQAAAKRLVEAGHPLGVGFMKMMEDAADRLADESDTEKQLDAQIDLQARLSALALPSAPAGETVCERPNIKIIRAAFTMEECDYMIGAAAPLLSRTLVVDGNTDQSRADPHRTAWGVSFLPGSLDMPIVRLTEKLAATARTIFSHAEPLTVLRYRPGEEYRPHHDFLAENESDLAARGPTRPNGADLSQ